VGIGMMFGEGVQTMIWAMFGFEFIICLDFVGWIGAMVIGCWV